LGRAQLVEGAELVSTLPTGHIEVQLRRNRWGLVSEIAVVHGPPPTGARARAFTADLAHHRRVAEVAQGYSGLLGEIRELLERLASRMTGRPRGPLELELELSKLQGRIEDRMRRLADPRGVSAGEARAYRRDIASFRNQIEGHRAAIARGDPRSGRIAQQGTPDGHPPAPPGYVYRYDTARARWDLLPDQLGGPRLRVERDAAGAVTGRFTNLEQVESLGLPGLSLENPATLERLASLGYAVDPTRQLVRPAAGLPDHVAAALVPLRVVDGRVEINPRVHLDVSVLGTSSAYHRFRGQTLDAESIVASHGTVRRVHDTGWVSVAAAATRGRAETLWRRASLYRLVDYVRYHIVGPGTGTERFRIFLAPEGANQFANNHIEGFMRRIRDSTPSAAVSYRVRYQTFSGPELRGFIDDMLTSGDQRLLRLLARDQGKFERLLKSAVYDIRVVDAHGVSTYYRATVDVGVPGPQRTGSVVATPPTVVPAPSP
jgi:hypothetical protein